MVPRMTRLRTGLFIVMLTTAPALAERETAADSLLAPCLAADATLGGATSVPTSMPGAGWGVDVATTISKQDTLDAFAQMQQDYKDVLGNVEPFVVAQCNLSMGTKLQYSARIGAASRDDAESLCDKIRQAGGACIVQKNQADAP